MQGASTMLKSTFLTANLLSVVTAQHNGTRMTLIGSALISQTRVICVLFF